MSVKIRETLEAWGHSTAQGAGGDSWCCDTLQQGGELNQDPHVQESKTSHHAILPPVNISSGVAAVWMFVSRHGYLDRAMRERDAQLEAQRQAHTEQLQRSEEQMVKLQEDSEVMAAQARRAQKDHEEALEQRDDTIHRWGTSCMREESTLDSS